MIVIPQPLRMEPIDLTRHHHLFDGYEPDDYSQLVKLPEGTGSFEVAFSAIAFNGFAYLERILGKPAFQEVVAGQGYRQPEGQFGGWYGEDGLQVSYFLRGNEPGTSTELYLMSFGEFQPARYKVHFEGHWRIHHPESKM